MIKVHNSNAAAGRSTLQVSWVYDVEKHRLSESSGYSLNWDCRPLIKMHEYKEQQAQGVEGLPIMNRRCSNLLTFSVS
jgi:hypothetical protein